MGRDRGGHPRLPPCLLLLGRLVSSHLSHIMPIRNGGHSALHYALARSFETKHRVGRYVIGAYNYRSLSITNITYHKPRLPTSPPPPPSPWRSTDGTSSGSHSTSGHTSRRGDRRRPRERSNRWGRRLAAGTKRCPYPKRELSMTSRVLSQTLNDLAPQRTTSARKTLVGACVMPRSSRLISSRGFPRGFSPSTPRFRSYDPKYPLHDLFLRPLIAHYVSPDGDQGHLQPPCQGLRR
jgi:hypothetical protein